MASRCGLLVATMLTLGAGPAWSDDFPPGPPCVPGQPGRGGTVTEHSSRPNATFIVHLTDFNYQDIPGADLFPPSIPDGHGGTTIVPLDVPAMAGLCDARNDTILMPARGGRNGPRADLSIESLHFNADTQTYVLTNIWGTIEQQLGPDAVVAIPDLYIADSGGARDDVTLYSLVDLAIYLHALPTFTEGESFDIVDGRTAALSGMYFSTDPFTFDPLTGFSDPPYTGTAIAITEHGFSTTSVSEPTTFALLVAGVLGLLVVRRRPHRDGS
ncbi:MAG: PEP-CTERM sorting domain-containing protein [Ramlibacter sp.]